jgi:3(or 17)beta-hydroxysteroid dehydrogenase
LVNSIRPGLIQTDMGEQTFVSPARNLSTNDVDAVRQQAMAKLPIGRLGVPDDIAKASSFSAPNTLAS